MRPMQIIRKTSLEGSSAKVKRGLQIAGIVIVTTGAVAALGAWLVRDQIERSRRDLFSSQPLRRLAALGYISGHGASVDVVRLLRDYISWEPRPLIRRRATQILQRMERDLSESPPAAGEIAG